MKKKEIRHIVIPMVGMVLLIAAAILCYSNVENTLIGNEQKSLKSLAKGNAQSLQESLETKEELLSALFSENMESEREIEAALLKTREKGSYIEVETLLQEEDWMQEVCENARMQPWDVIVGPILKKEEHFVLYMTKAVSLNGYISGYANLEINLDEVYETEQALSDLEVENSRFCIVKSSDGTTIMPGSYSEERISFSRTAENECTIEWVYEANGVTPERVRKLIASEALTIGMEEMTLYIIEDYDQIMQPIEQIAFYFSVIGIAILLVVIGFMYKLYEEQKKQVVLEAELSHEKKLNETMKKQEGLMQKYNHSKTMSVLTGSIAHEFNNLMTPIVLYAELLEESEAVREEFPDEITELKNTAYRCEELARQLLSYSRQGRVEKVLTDYDATYAMREAISMIRKLVPERVVLKESICKTSYMIHGQVGALNQIVLNLATNAFHAMKEGGTLKISFGLSTEDDRYVRLIMEDTGVGIPMEVQRKVFQPFFTTKKAGEGTGIGLTVVKRLTEEHGGMIRAQSTEGKGTTFILDFPRRIE